MIEFMPESADNTVGVRATGKLTHEDYRDVLIPGLEARIARHGTQNVLVLFDEGFEGWELEAAWDDASLGLTHRSDFGKVAVVGGPEWVRWCLKLCAFLFKGEFRFFDPGHLDQAWAWVKG